MAEPRLTLAQAYALARAAGFGPLEAVVAAAIAKAESGLRVAAHNLGSPGRPEDSRGLWQINVRAHPWADPARLLADPSYNAQAAYRVYVNAGRRFTPWTVYTSGAYQANLDAARAAAASLPDDPALWARLRDQTAAVPAGLGLDDLDRLRRAAGKVPGLLDDVLERLNPAGRAADAVGDALRDAASGTLLGLGRLMVQGSLLVGAVALVVLGAARTVRESPGGRQIEQQLQDAAGAVA